MKHINEKEYNELLASKKLIVMEYSGATCAPCLVLERELNTIEEDYPNVVFAKVYLTDILEEAVGLGIMTTPTTIIYSNGRASMRFVGANSKQKIKSALDLVK